ncbi:MAG TPA: hypothetical protein DIW64_22235 [Cellvibrio sp.]|nr:hypothetical protein [Cellvibrio sp.]
MLYEGLTTYLCHLNEGFLTPNASCFHCLFFPRRPNAETFWKNTNKKTTAAFATVVNLTA